MLLLVLLVPVLALAAAPAAEAATLRVNTTQDQMSSKDGKCSLREAIEAANHPGTKTDCGTADNVSNLILLGAGTFQLSIPPGPGDSDQNCIAGTTSPDQNASGDLCVTSNAALTITGNGPTTVIAGQSSLQDRLMTIAPQASVALAALKMEGGHAPDGTGATACMPLAPASPTPDGNGANGGAVYNTGSLFTNMVTFDGNSAGGGGAGDDVTGGSGCTGGSGGAIYNLHRAGKPRKQFPGSLTVQNTMFTSNVAGGGGSGGSPSASGPGGSGGNGGSGGAIYNDRGTLHVSNASFTSNTAGSGGQGGDSGGGNGGTGGDGSPGGGIFSTRGSLSVINATFTDNQAGSGAKGGNDTGGAAGGNGGTGADGGALAVNDSPSGLRNATLQGNILGTGGPGGTGSPGGNGGKSGTAGGIFVQSSKPADNLTLQNTIVASSVGLNCSPRSAITDGGHNLNFPASDTSCPAASNGDPELTSSPDNYGGYSLTLALEPGSAAINQVPKAAGCPATDQRGVRRPQGPACDIGAFEFARPKIEIDAPRNGVRYKRGARVHAGFRCIEGGITSPIKTCSGTVANGERVNTSSLGRKSFKVTATDKEGNKSSKTVHYTVVR